MDIFNKREFEKWKSLYIQDFTESWWPKERYKWEAVKHFQDNWDINAPDFGEMLKKSLQKTNNLVPWSALREIKKYAITFPKIVRNMFQDLFDEDKEIFLRYDNFKKMSKELEEKLGSKFEHDQDENAISLYLWFRFPDKYYPYKIGVLRNVAAALSSHCEFKNAKYENNINNFYALYNAIHNELTMDENLKIMLSSHIDDKCYSDKELRTLTQDFCWYINVNTKASNEIDSEASGDSKESQIIEKHSTHKDDDSSNYWWLNANPKIWSYSNIKIGETVPFTLYNESGNKRRIFQHFLDVQPGDIVIGYESNPVKKVVALCEVVKGSDGKQIVIEKTENLANAIEYKTLKELPELENLEYFNNSMGSLFKVSDEEFAAIMDLIREENPIWNQVSAESYTKEDFLKDVYLSEDDYEKLAALLERKKNIILQGAPGTGKTYAAKRLAFALMGSKDDDRVKVVQFHQNYSYEDFVMGYKPTEDGFELKDGIFYQFCQKASNHPDELHFFIIDEINRGNLSKIFGELLMLIEADYRGENATLAYNSLLFSVPENLRIIGMMNTADRSLALIDYALRRRFAFFEMKPALTQEKFLNTIESTESDQLQNLVSTVVELNEAIAEDESLGRGFQIGHSYFCNLEDISKSTFLSIVETELIPLLEEYWFDDSQKVETWSANLRNAL